MAHQKHKFLQVQSRQCQQGLHQKTHQGLNLNRIKPCHDIFIYYRPRRQTCIGLAQNESIPKFEYHFLSHRTFPRTRGIELGVIDKCKSKGIRQNQ